mmetsp:Transcript_19085/g.41460  ORF Transcript_19085/g.41460 Transcript_19085/m.41460 type:complete len:321 (+) Transcript_19085:267-1229(+)|eukprot:CAMPEP_0168191572 /NCGR_PEP_ID=MMETSP0139_2-20121125/17589_1 /TAXON_ID=44445 /ORGANISM="Pseudo-nitzschia australis, Strain 10249 10 AB" /LENGTH=320 /DNA_ID=CAMNT_0008114759 /DNA_START=183 /DNA_END=1145 /DNA_ORIENTATION=+
MIGATTAKGRVSIQLSILLFLLMASQASARRFVSSGPNLVITLKDPSEKYSSGASLNDDDGDSDEPLQNPWFNLGNLRPNIMWSLQSKGKPLPNWVPGWHSLRATVGYQHDEALKCLPSIIEADLKFASESTGVNLQVQPTYEFGPKQTTLSIQASRGAAAYVMAKIATKRDRWLQMVKGCYQATLPYASVGAVRVTPSLDLVKGHVSCLLEATTGSQRTKAVLNLEYDNPTLTVIHALNERNTIAPEISLYDATILYQWNLSLDSGLIRTRVDPTSDVRVTWIDQSMNGKWMTDVRMPLSGTTLSALAADIRVRRQFNF